MYFHTDNPDVITALAAALDRAQKTGRLRVQVDANGVLKYKVGGGMWTAPIKSTPDPYRDNP